MDTYFVSQLVTQQWAAMSLTFPVVMVFGSLAIGLGIDASSVIARAIGEGDRHKVQHLATNSLTLSVFIVGLFVTIGLTTTILTLTRMIFLYIPLAYLGNLILGVKGVFIAAFIANFLVVCKANQKLEAELMSLSAMKGYEKL